MIFIVERLQHWSLASYISAKNNFALVQLIEKLQNSLRHLNCYTIFLNGLFPDFIFILFKQSTEYKCWKRLWVTWFELRSSGIESDRCANCATTSVTRWLRYFSIFDHLQHWKAAPKHNNFAKHWMNPQPLGNKGLKTFSRAWSRPVRAKTVI